MMVATGTMLQGSRWKRVLERVDGSLNVLYCDEMVAVMQSAPTQAFLDHMLHGADVEPRHRS